MSFAIEADPVTQSVVFRTPVVILVEGNDDQAFLDAILTKAQADPLRVGVRVVGGKDNFGRYLGQLVSSEFAKSGGLERYVILRDGDSSVESSFREVADQVKLFEGNLSFPDRNKLRKSNSPFVKKFALHIVETAIDSHTLESLVFSSIGEGDTIRSCVHKFFVCFGFSGKSEYKRKMISYLLAADQGNRDVIRGVGRAAQLGVLDLDQPEIQAFTEAILSYVTPSMAG